MSTKVIAVRSISERGRRAERMPTGTETSIQRMAPPSTSEAVTGAAAAIWELTDCRFWNENPSEWSTTIRFRKFQYWM